MSYIERGRIEHGAIVLSRPVDLAEGTEVVVQIEPIEPRGVPEGAPTDLKSTQFFGMWSDRDDMRDSLDWLQRERDHWQQRATPQD